MDILEGQQSPPYEPGFDRGLGPKHFPRYVQEYYHSRREYTPERVIYAHVQQQQRRQPLKIPPLEFYNQWYGTRTPRSPRTAQPRAAHEQSHQTDMPRSSRVQPATQEEPSCLTAPCRSSGAVRDDGNASSR